MANIVPLATICSSLWFVVFALPSNQSLKLAEKQARENAARYGGIRSNNSVDARTGCVNLCAFRRRLAPVR